VRAYLEVEHARFGDRLHAEVQLEAAARGARVPTMIVQTLVENAVKHGAASVRGRAEICVVARREDDRLIISVSDNGPGFAQDWPERDPAQDSSPSTRSRGGYGLVNIRQRLTGYFGSGAALSVSRLEGTTVVSVSMPLTRQEPRPHPAQEVTR